jgi:hypothetical protein
MTIIQAILDYDLDLSVKYLCNHFQKFKLPPKQSKSVIDVENMMDMRVDK